MPDEVVKYYQYIEQDNLPAWEMEIKVECWIDPGQKGSTTSLGVPLEPSYGPCLDDYQPVEARFLYPDRDGNWHDYDYFVNKWDIENKVEFDHDRLFESCAEKEDHPPIDI